MDVAGVGLHHELRPDLQLDDGAAERSLPMAPFELDHLQGERMTKILRALPWVAGEQLIKPATVIRRDSTTLL